ncbi:MAG: THUMP-like domain-containing protein, partial [Candidatus Promineifilaceae bacterium]
QLNAVQIDSTIAYLTSEKLVETPFARRFEVEAWFPFQLKTLRRYLRERSVGHVVMKKRGSPLEPDQLKRQLKLKGSNSRTLFLTRTQGDPIVIVSPTSAAGF